MSEHTYGGLTDAQLDALHAAATPGPYMAERCYDGARTVCQLRSIDSTVCINVESDRLQVYAKTNENAAYIAAACNALPHLTARVRELEADLATASKGYAARVRELEAQLAAAREDSARLDWLIDQDSDGLPEHGGMLSDALWDSAAELCPIDSAEADDTRKWMRAAIDSARGAK